MLQQVQNKTACLYLPLITTDCALTRPRPTGYQLCAREYVDDDFSRHLYHMLFQVSVGRLDENLIDSISRRCGPWTILLKRGFQPNYEILPKSFAQTLYSIFFCVSLFSNMAPVELCMVLLLLLDCTGAAKPGCIRRLPTPNTPMLGRAHFVAARIERQQNFFLSLYFLTGWGRS
jgi:hypothetical protein